MSEQLYYTYSTIGSGSTTGERIRAQSPGVGSVNSESVRALMKYLSYKLPIGADLRTSIDEAPISLVLAQTDYDRILSHRKYAGKDGVGRPGNFFAHAIVNPEVVISPQAGTTSRISAYDAISLWRSPFWKTSEEQAPPKSTVIESLHPQDITHYPNMTWQGKLSAASLRLQYPHCPAPTADWLPLVFSAFLMLKKLAKKQLYIAAPSEMVATFIWCIARCLPCTLDIMQDLTFSTYEREVGKIQMTITGTCWLPPINHNGPFIPQTDLPNPCYQPVPANPVLAINCYTQKQTSFEIDEQVVKFAQFATQSLLQNNLKQLDAICTEAEKRGHQNVDDFLALFRIQQEPATKAMVQETLANPQLWFCLQYDNILDKLIELLKDIQDRQWRTWWETQGVKLLKRMYQQALKLPQSGEAAALSALANRVVQELYHELADNQQESNKWVTYWDHLLNATSSPSHDPVVWATLPQRLSRLSYTKTYQFWWQQSGKKITKDLSQIANDNTQTEAHQQLTTELGYWWQQCAGHLRQTWNIKQQQETEMRFWLDILSTIQLPTSSFQDWHTLLNDLDKTLPPGELPVNWCEWEIYQRLLLAWYNAQLQLPAQWLIVDWKHLPHLLDILNLPDEWKNFALTYQIQHFRAPEPPQIFLSYVAKCSPLIYEVLAQLIEKSDEREQAVTFCEFLLKKNYTERDALLTTILPSLLPDQKQTDRIAKAAKLEPEQLNEFVEETLYKTLSSQQDTPAWLSLRLENYLLHFRISQLIPDPQQADTETRKRTRAILDALIKRGQALPPGLQYLRPSIACWHTLGGFFRNPLFSPNTLQDVCLHIKLANLSDTIRKELYQEMIAFLAVNVRTEGDLVRAIDNTGELLVNHEKGAVWANVLLLKEMARLMGEHTRTSYITPKIILYIKVILGETSDLSYLGLVQEEQERFVDDCLNSLLGSLSVEGIQTTQWPTYIANKWRVYLSRRRTGKSTEMTKSTASLSLTRQDSPVPANNAIYGQNYPPASSSSGGSQPQIRLPGPPQGEQTQHNPKEGVVKNRQGQLPYIEDEIKAFRKALKGKRVDKIAEAYNQRLDTWLTYDEIQTASIAQKVVQSHDHGRKTGDYNNFILTYNSCYLQLVMSDDMNATVKRLRKEQEKRK